MSEAKKGKDNFYLIAIIILIFFMIISLGAAYFNGSGYFSDRVEVRYNGNCWITDRWTLHSGTLHIWVDDKEYYLKTFKMETLKVDESGCQ